MLKYDKTKSIYHLRSQETYEQFEMLTSTGMVSPGKTNTVSPTRTSSVGTSMQIASEQRTVSAAGLLSDAVITSRD